MSCWRTVGNDTLMITGDARGRRLLGRKRVERGAVLYRRADRTARLARSKPLIPRKKGRIGFSLTGVDLPRDAPRTYVEGGLPLASREE